MDASPPVARWVAPGYEGWFGVTRNRYALHNAVEDLAARMPEPFQYLEIGVWLGASLLRVLRHSHPASITIVDTLAWYPGGPRQGQDWLADLLVALGYAGRSSYLVGDSRTELPKLTGCWELVTVDGGHDGDTAESDLRHAWPLVAPGGFLVFDDLGHPAHPELPDLFERVRVSLGAPLIFRTHEPMGVAVLRKPEKP